MDQFFPSRLLRLRPVWSVLAGDEFQVPIVEQRLLCFPTDDAVALVGLNGEFTFSADVPEARAYSANPMAHVWGRLRAPNAENPIE